MEIAATAIDKVLTDLGSQPDPRWKTLASDKQRKQIQIEFFGPQRWHDASHDKNAVSRSTRFRRN